jgi:hypothetical protein
VGGLCNEQIQHQFQLEAARDRRPDAGLAERRTGSFDDGCRSGRGTAATVTTADHAGFCRDDDWRLRFDATRESDV